MGKCKFITRLLRLLWFFYFHFFSARLLRYSKVPLQIAFATLFWYFSSVSNVASWLLLKKPHSQNVKRMIKTFFSFLSSSTWINFSIYFIFLPKYHCIIPRYSVFFPSELHLPYSIIRFLIFSFVQVPWGIVFAISLITAFNFSFLFWGNLCPSLFRFRVSFKSFFISWFSV